MGSANVRSKIEPVAGHRELRSVGRFLRRAGVSGRETSGDGSSPSLDSGRPKTASVDRPLPHMTLSEDVLAVSNDSGSRS